MMNITNPAEKFKHLCESHKTIWMGIVNITQDSFSDGGEFIDVNTALAQAQLLVKQGATIIDFGAVATNPKVTIENAISPEEELNRIFPVLTAARQVLPNDVLISVDTQSEFVAQCLAEHNLIDVLNDISCQLYTTAAKFGLGYILMHKGHVDSFEDLIGFLCKQAEISIKHGVSYLAIDPGIGYGQFGKTFDQIMEILSADGISKLVNLPYPVLIGLSRKTFIRDLNTDKNVDLSSPKSRDKITKILEKSCIDAGVKIIRTHCCMNT